MTDRGFVKYADFHNDGGSGRIVYAKLVDPNGKVLWDGRKVRGFQWEMEVGQSVTVNIENDAEIPDGVSFCLGYNVVAGDDVQDLNNVFEATAGGSSHAKCEFTNSQGITYDGISN